MSASLTSTRRARIARSDSSEDHGAGDDGRRAVGVEAGDVAALGEGQRREPAEDALAGGRAEPVAVHPLGVVGVELEVDRGERGGGAGDGDAACRRRRARPAGTLGGQTAASSGEAQPARRAVGGSEREVALGVAHGAHAGWRRGSAGSSPGAPTTYSVLPPPMSMTSAGPPGGPSAVAPRKVSRASSLAWDHPRVARRRSRRRLSASSAPFSASRMALVATATTRLGAEEVDAARGSPRAPSAPRVHGGVAQPAAGLEALAEARDAGPPFELGRRSSSFDVGHEQPRGVRAEVDTPMRRTVTRGTLPARGPAASVENPGPRLEAPIQVGNLAVATRGGAVR